MAEDNRLTSPDTSMYPRFQPMPQINPLAQVNDLINLQHNVQGVQQQQLQLGMGRLNYMHQQLGALAAKVDPKTMQPNASMDDVKNVIGSLADAGVPQWQVQKELQKFQGKDAAGIQDLARQHMAQIADHAATMGMAFGEPVTHSQGDVDLFGRRNVYNPGQVTLPGAAQGSSGTMLPRTLTPGEKASRVPAIVGGVQSSIPQASVADRYGLPLPAAPQAGTSAPLNLQPRGLATPAAAATPQAAPQVAGAPPGTLQTGQAPGVEASAASEATLDAQRARDLEAAYGSVPNNKAILARIVQASKDISLGPMSQAIKKGGGLVNQASGFLGGPDIFPDQPTREAFDKDVALLSGQQSQTLGNTDAAKGLAEVMNPSSRNTSAGVQRIAAILQGNQDAIAAKGQAWNAYKNSLPSGVARVSDFESQFHKKFSPRAFSMVYMSQPEREKMWNSMDAREQKAVAEAYDEAKKKGYIQVGPNTQAPSP